MKDILQKIAAVVGDHPDPMSDPKINPDIDNFRITKTPVLIITGSKDKLEPVNSSWEDFVQIKSN